MRDFINIANKHSNLLMENMDIASKIKDIKFPTFDKEMSIKEFISKLCRFYVLLNYLKELCDNYIPHLDLENLSAVLDEIKSELIKFNSLNKLTENMMSMPQTLDDKTCEYILYLLRDAKYTSHVINDQFKNIAKSAEYKNLRELMSKFSEVTEEIDFFIKSLQQK